MGEVMKSPNRRQRGNIDKLPSGALRVRVYSGRDPVTKRPVYVGETIPAGTPNIQKDAEQALTRWLNRVDEHRAPRTNATVDQLVDAYLEVVDIDRKTMRGWRSKMENHIRPIVGPRPINKTVIEADVFEKFYAELRRCRLHCGKRPRIDHRTARPHDCDHRCRPHQCVGLGASMIREIHTILTGAYRRAVVWGVDWGQSPGSGEAAGGSQAEPAAAEGDRGVAPGRVIDALFTEWQAIFTGLPTMRQHGITDAAQRINAHGWLDALATAEDPANDTIRGLLEDRGPQRLDSPSPTTVTRQRHHPTPPPLLTVARDENWLKVDTVGIYR